MNNRVPLKPGDTIYLSNDTYTIIRLLAEGGTSLIYEAERLYCDQDHNPKWCFNKKVLLKELAPLSVPFTRRDSGELVFTDTDVTILKQLFENEIENLAVVQEKNTRSNRIPDMDSYGEYNNTMYIAMNHIRGDLLSDYLGKKRMTDAEIRDIFTQLVRVVGFLHGIDEDYCHLDLKPHNFIIDALDSVYLFDFGSSIIEEGKWINNCTENYSAPEVVYNMVELVGQRSDIYSLGAILFEMVAGERAEMDHFLLCGGRFCDESRCTRYDYNSILSRMLAEDVSRRFPSVRHVSAALERLFGDNPVDTE